MKKITKKEIWKEQDMDPAFVMRDRCRKAGVPVEIARTGRLLVRETVMADVPRLYEIRRLPEMGDYMEPVQPALKEEEEFMEAYIRYMYAFYDFGLWTVLERESSQVIGRAGLFPSKILEEGVELGYMIAPERQRRGYASECIRAILDYASDVLDLMEVHALIDSRNLASVRTAEKCGFTEQEKIQKGEMEFRHFLFRKHW